MYAIVDIAGQQFKVEKNTKLFVHRLEGEEGAELSFPEVLLLDQDGSISVGTPHVSGAVVTAKILNHLKGDKVLVFKKKRRKTMLRSGRSDLEIANAIMSTWAERDDHYSEIRGSNTANLSTGNRKVEMSYIGG